MNVRGYQKFRASILEKRGRVCERCGAHDSSVLHHIKPRAEYPELELAEDNVLVVCSRCHAKEHGRHPLSVPYIQRRRQAQKPPVPETFKHKWSCKESARRWRVRDK